MSGAAAGWYPQPDGTQRYWDGTAWTAHTAPGQVPPPSYPQQQPYGAPYYAGQPGAVTPKQPALMLLVSFFIPGLGTMMNGETAKGVAILVGYGISIPFVLIFIGLPFMFGFWIWGMVDAYQGAERWNRAHGVRA